LSGSSQRRSGQESLARVSPPGGAFSFFDEHHTHALAISAPVILRSAPLARVSKDGRMPGPSSIEARRKRGEHLWMTTSTTNRHCERSEAIHLAERRKGGLLRFARNDG
jgi:hypothetical protein